MDFKSVAAAEVEFKATGNKNRGQAYELTPFSIPIPGDANWKLDGITCRPKNGYTGYFYDEKTTKKKIVLHFTVGHLRGDIGSLTSQDRGHVSTSFVLARDGSIYQLFSSAAWSYHLGKDAIGGNGAQSKISIGIEISNYGPLTKRGDNLETAYSTPPGKDIYCTIQDTDQYIKLDTPYRGYRYFAAFTNEQYHNLILLLRYLTASYNIPRKFLPLPDRYEAKASASADFEGICSHVNFRSDKFDIGPAFDWDRVISGVTAPVYGGNPLEDTVKKAEEKVAAAEKALEEAKAELVAAQEALENSQVATRSAEKVYSSEEEMDEDRPASRGVEPDHGDNGPELFEINKAPFYE
jgi:N-acetyl-anhydromuramyl-L-alanine amidase AmpD